MMLDGRWARLVWPLPVSTLLLAAGLFLLAWPA